MTIRLSRATRSTLAALSLGACAKAPAPSAPPTPAAMTGERLLRAMHDRYANTWYKTLTFVQKTTVAPPQGGPDRISTYYESMAIPGRLRIDTDLPRGGGTLFANDSQYVVVNNTVRRTAPGYNVLQVLGFDVYGQPVERTVAMLGALRLPLSPVREGTWQDRKVWIVGARDGDLRSSQFWVDQERLVFVRLLQPSPADSMKTFEARFEGYQPVDRAWIAPVVRAFVDGKQTLLEEYTDIRTDRPLNEALFDPKRWATAPHWARGR